jgi:hypothetical protein
VGCFIALVSLFSVRLALFLVWIFTVFVALAFLVDVTSFGSASRARR